MPLALIMAIDNEDDKKYFSRLYSDYEQLVYKIAFKYLNDEYDAEDCVNTVFLEIIKNFESFRTVKPEKRTAFIYRMTLRHAARIAGERHRAAADFCFNDAVFIDNEASDESGFEKVELAGMISAIAERYQVPLLLRYCADLPYSEIGKRLNISEEAARQAVKRGRDILKKYYIREGMKNE